MHRRDKYYLASPATNIYKLIVISKYVHDMLWISLRRHRFREVIVIGNYEATSKI
jgi:hypothetical protein